MARSNFPSRQFSLASVAGASVLAVVVAGCGGGDGVSTAGTGTMRLAMTDAPACGYDAVNVTVQKVRVHKSSTAADTDAGWSEIVLSPPKRVDLLSLTNGVLTELGETPLEPGKYMQMRLVLGSNGGATPLANSVVLSRTSAELGLTTPSAQQSGVKMNVDLDVAPGKLVDLVLDFDACKSIVAAGASAKYLLRPVVSVIPCYISGVQGFVAMPIAGGATSVTLQQNGVVVRSTVPDGTGKFLLQPVAPGTYDVVVHAPGRATAVVTNVVVASETVSSIDTIASRLDPPASTSNGTIAGAVAMPGVPSIEAMVSARQTLSGGRTIEVTGGPVDADSGQYSYLLPLAAPVVANYAVPPAVMTFTPDASAQGKYGVTAVSGTTTKSQGPFTLTGGGTTSVNFSFP